MDIDHDTTLWLSKVFGLFYLIALFFAVVIYAYWPSNKTRFNRAAHSILRGEEEPWQ